jgi:hypothetical protein
MKTWKNISSKNIIQFDFEPPAVWSEGEIAEEMAIFANAISNTDTVQTHLKNHVELARRLPK